MDYCNQSDTPENCTPIMSPKLTITRWVQVPIKTIKQIELPLKTSPNHILEPIPNESTSVKRYPSNTRQGEDKTIQKGRKGKFLKSNIDI